MFSFFKRTSFHGVSLNNVAYCSDDWKAELQQAVKGGIASGVVKPFKSRLFLFQQRAQAVLHSKLRCEEKVVLCLKQQDRLQVTNGATSYDPHNLVIIAGTGSELWMDVAEWLVRNGARRLVVLSDADDDEAQGASLRRVNKLIDVSHCTLAFTPSSRVETHEEALDFFKDMLRMGTILSIFCVSMDENGGKMKSLDSASRELVPNLPQFVSLLGMGYGVSEGRAASGLPVCSLRSDSSIHSLTHVLPYLSDILAEENTTARFFNIADSTTETSRSENEDCQYQSFLPTTLEELEDLDEGGVMFQEVTTRSPRLCHVRHTLLPVFLVSGLGVQGVQPLLRQLAYPAFVATLPTGLQHSVEEYAELLMLEMTKIQPKGPYNIIGLSWGGAAALELGGLLESRGHRVELMLLEGAPASLRGRIQELCDHHQADLPTSLLACVFHLPPKMVVALGCMSSWDEMLSSCLTALPEEKRVIVNKGVSALHAQLTALQQYQPCSQRVCNNLTLFTSKPLSHSDTSLLSQHCKFSPKIVVTGSDTFNQLMSDTSTATVINENVAFDVNI